MAILHTSSQQSSEQLHDGKSPSDYIFERLFANIPLDKRATFTPEQIKVLRRACRNLAPKQHVLDWRITIPCPGLAGFYLIVLSGPEQRSPERTRIERRNFRNFVVALVGTAVLSGVALVSVWSINRHANTAQDSSPHPTSLPWVESAEACVGEGRFWEEGQCWDASHNPNF